MPLSINDAGTWREINGVFVNDAGTWREIQEVYVNDAGTWRTVFQNLTVQLSNDAYSRSQNTASFSLLSTGEFQATDGGAASTQYNWLVAGSASSVEVRVTPTSGSFSTGTTGAWISLASTRTYTRAWSGGMSSDSVTATVELRNAFSAVVLATATITLVATP
jgi:hypothetical protein